MLLMQFHRLQRSMRCYNKEYDLVPVSLRKSSGWRWKAPENDIFHMHHVASSAVHVFSAWSHRVWSVRSLSSLNQVMRTYCVLSSLPGGQRMCYPCAVAVRGKEG